MSNREIIEWLKKKAEAVPMPGARKMYEAAAKALEAAQPEHGTNLAEVGTDCISRQSAIDAFNTNIDELVVAGKENADSVERYLNRVIDEIKQLPPIQPKRGRWESVPHKRARICSCCGHDEPYKFADDDAPIYNFCPYCGADMRGEQDG